MGREHLDKLVNKCRGARKIVAYRERDAHGEWTLRWDEYEGRRLGFIASREEAEYVATHARLPLVWIGDPPAPLPAHRLLWMSYDKQVPAGVDPIDHENAARRTLRKTIGDVARERGELRERRALASTTTAPLPTWLRSVRKATLDEDRHGADLIGESDVGQLKVQVKGCAAAARNFRESHRYGYIEVVVVGGHESDETIRGRVLGAFGRARDTVRKQRGETRTT